MVIGVDIGATSSKIGLVDESGKIVDRGVIASNTTDNEHIFIANLLGNIDMLKNRNGIDSIEGIGIGAPNGNFKRGTIEFAQNTSWGRNKIINLAQIVSTKTGVECVITNDANASAMGEMRYGAAVGFKNFIEITLGTGLGAGVVVDGKIVYGHTGMAAELGHYRIFRGENFRRCTCGRNGCLEAYCSATGVANNAREMLNNAKLKSTLSNYSTDKITAETVYIEASKGDTLAKEVFALEGKLLGEAFADFVSFFSPEAIVLFGGLTKAKEFFFPTLIESFNKNLMSQYKNTVEILFSTLPNSDAAILGAASIINNKKNKAR